jgi:hypothetical protein
VAPLFIGEFGVDQSGADVAGNRYFTCLLAFLAAFDLDWAYWALQGSYYFPTSTTATPATTDYDDDDDDDDDVDAAADDFADHRDEPYGILNAAWSAPRNTTFLAKLQALQQPWRIGTGTSYLYRDQQD